MKFHLNDLKDKTSIEFDYDYKEEIKKHQDILEIGIAYVKAEINSTANKLVLDVFVKVEMELACSKTLKPVPYELNFDAKVVFSNSNDGDYLLEPQLDLTSIIFGYIISEKPYTVYHLDAKDLYFEEEKSSHSAFADLDNIYKK